MSKYQLYFMFALALIVMPMSSFAQQPAAAQAQTDGTAAAVEETTSEDAQEQYDGSLFFTDGEVLKIRAALAGNLDVAIQAGEEVAIDPTKPRLITLSGIAYTDANDWMVWINGARVTPYAGLQEIVDIYVQKNYVDLKWFDKGSQKIIRIRLRPNQVYDINAGILLPG